MYKHLTIRTIDQQKLIKKQPKLWGITLLISIS